MKYTHMRTKLYKIGLGQKLYVFLWLVIVIRICKIVVFAIPFLATVT